MRASALPALRAAPFDGIDSETVLIEPCNAVSNGMFLTLFGMPEVCDRICPGPQSTSAPSKKLGNPGLDVYRHDAFSALPGGR